MDTAAPSSLHYRAFICYSHRDQRWARWLHRALESYRVPRRLVGETTEAGTAPARLSPIFRDREELPSASDLSQKINEALEQSANLIVICSPDAAKSRWVDAEVRAFKRMGRAERIFCLIVGGEPDGSDQPGRAAEECFVPALRFRFDSDGQPTSERVDPVAADGRADKDGKSDAKLKLIAGLLGVGFDVLKQREHHRRVRGLMAVAAAALLMMLIMTGLAIDAVIARKAAVTAREAAERRQKQAENLVEYLLGDLNDQLRRVQRLDVLEGVDDKAMTYFQSLSTVDVTDQVLAQRVKALQKIGAVRADQGKLPAALESFRAASALAEELARRAPADVTRQADYAASLNWVGNAYWSQGDLGQAMQNFRQAIGLLEQASASRPADRELAKTLASARTNAGRVLEARGDFDGARRLYEDIRRAFESLRVEEPQNSRWQSELGYAYDNLGKVALEQGQLDQAIGAYRDVRRIKAALAAGDPKDFGAQEALLISDAILGRTLALCGAQAAALNHVRDAVNRAKSLTDFDGTQTPWRVEWADYTRLLGGLLRLDGKFDEAGGLDGAAVRTLSELVAADPSNSRWRRKLAAAQTEAARIKLAKGDLDAAASLLTDAVAQIHGDRAATIGDRDLILLKTQISIALGQVAAKRHDATAARNNWIEARDGIAPVAQVGNDPNFLAGWASALLLLHEDSAARPVVAKLAALGYRSPDLAALVPAALSRQIVGTAPVRCSDDEVANN
jgi:eukaryotic-like serine/threonine-protein kinase